MAMKIFAVFALLSLAAASPNAGREDPVYNNNPIDALTWFRGFAYGAQQSDCYTTYCYYNVTYFVTELQDGLNLLKNFLNGNLEPVDIFPLLCNWNSIYTDWLSLSSVCNVDGFITSTKLFLNQDGLQQVGYNVVVNLGIMYNWLQVTQQGCDNQWYNCGHAAGIAYTTMTGWYIPNTDNLLGADLDVSDYFSYVDGFMTGYANPEYLEIYLRAKAAISSLGGIHAGDLSELRGLADDVIELSQLWKKVKISEVSFDLDSIYEKAYANIGEVLDKVDLDCEGKNCGEMVGSILRLLLN